MPTTTAMKKARRAAKEAAIAAAERDNRPKSLSARELRLAYAAAGLPAPSTPVIPDITELPTDLCVAVGDRVQLLARRDFLFPNAKGRILQLKREHGIVSALVRLDRKNSAGFHLKVWRCVVDMYRLAEGEWRQPRPRIANVEQLTVYATPFG